MNNNDLNKQRHIFEKIYHLAYLDGLNMDVFLEHFFTSSYSQYILEYSDVDYIDPNNVYQRYKNEFSSLYSEKSKTHYDWIVIKYAAFILVKAYQRCKESPKKICRYLSFDKIVQNFDLYHTLADEKVIFLSKVDYSLSLNNKRKARINHNISTPLYNSLINLLLAKIIYLKLFYYPEIEHLRYAYENIDFQYLYDDNNLLISKEIDDYQSLKEILNDESLDKYKFNKSNNILFIYLKKDIQIDKDELLNDFRHQGNIPFDKLFIYHDGLVHFVNMSVGLLDFYIPLTSLDYRKCVKEAGEVEKVNLDHLLKRLQNNK